MAKVTFETEYGTAMEATKIVDISFLPAWIQFWLVQVWWLITAPHHYVYSERQRATGRKLFIFCSAKCGQLMEKYLLFRGKK